MHSIKHCQKGAWTAAVATAVLVALGVAIGAVAFAQDKDKPAAPNYPNATGDRVDVSGKHYQTGTGSGEFFTRDPLAKVKAFYEPKTGPFGARKSGELYAVVELLPLKEVSVGEDGGVSAYATAEVRLTGAQAPDIAKMSDAELRQWAKDARHISRLADYVDWGEDPRGSERLTPEQRRQMREAETRSSGKHSAKEFRDLAARYGYLATAWFLGHQDSDLAEKYDKRSSSIREQREAARSQQGEREQQQMMKDMERRRAESRENAQRERANPGSVYKATPEEEAFRKAMDRKPKLRDEYIAATNRAVQAAMQRDMTTARAETEKAKKLVRSDPEISAAYDRMEAANAKRGREQLAAASAKQQQNMDRIYGGMRADAEAAGWNNWKEFIVELDKVAYRTRIVIDRSLEGGWHEEAKKPGAVVRGQAEIAKQKQAGDQRVAEYCKKNNCGGGRSGADPGATAGKPAPGKPAQQPAKEDSATDKMRQGADEGVKMFKKLFQ